MHIVLALGLNTENAHKLNALASGLHQNNEKYILFIFVLSLFNTNKSV